MLDKQLFTREIIALIIITAVVAIFITALGWGSNPEYLGLAAIWIVLMSIYGIYPRLAAEQAKRT